MSNGNKSNVPVDDGNHPKNAVFGNLKNDQKCPICLSDIEDLTFALDCNHEFCFECISHWINQRNRCPVCRQVIHHIRHQVRTPSGQLNVQDIPVRTNPADTEARILNFGFFTLVQTANESPMFVIHPMRFRSLFRYVVRMLEQNQIYYLTNIRAGTMFVTPDNMEEVIGILENAGITRYDSDSHGVEVKRHPRFMHTHFNHEYASTQSSSRRRPSSMHSIRRQKNSQIRRFD